jgi:hypothetical protein
MIISIRKSPSVCLPVSLGRLLVRRLTYSRDWIGTTLKMENGDEYHIFRHITCLSRSQVEHGSVFIMRFKFARLSHKTNKFVSQFPMLLITGFPGFRTETYAVNTENGYWLGLYQWESKRALEDYKQSFVLQVMNRRAIDDSVTYREFDRSHLIDYLEEYKLEKFPHTQANMPATGRSVG